MIDIYGAANALLGAVQGQMSAMEVNGKPWQEPSRVGVVPGANTAYDGDQLTVNWVTLPIGLPGKEISTPVLPNAYTLFYTFTITLLRVVSSPDGSGPDGGAPTPGQLNDDSVMLMGDAECLLQALINVHAQGLVLPVNEEFQFGPFASLGPEGTLAGCRMPVAFPAGMNTQAGY